MLRSPRLRFLAPLLILGLLSSCGTLRRIVELDFVDFPESRVANLEALHRPSGEHHYAAEMQGDYRYLIASQGKRMAGVHIGKPRSQTPGEGEQDVIRNPGEVCLELLNELLEFDASDSPRLQAIQISWCARLAAEDPSVLTRERAVIALGDFGVGLEVSGPRMLGLADPRADADVVAGHLSKLIAAFRKQRDGTSSLGSSVLVRNDAPPLDEAIAIVREETYDLDGARRVLYACASLLQNSAEDRPETVAMTALVIHMQQLTIELALGHGIMDSSGLVRGSAAVAAVRCGNDLTFAQTMSVLRGEEDPAGLSIYLGVLLERGLPPPSKQLNGDAYNAARESWLEALISLAVQNPESFVRTRAMSVLRLVAEGGPDSLREEEWEAWWIERFGLTPELEDADTTQGSEAP